MPSTIDNTTLYGPVDMDSSVAPLSNKVYWWIAFGVATQVLASFFTAFRDFTLVPSVSTGLQLAVVVVMVALTLGFMVYDGYVKEREKGTIQKPFAPFEHLYQRQLNRQLIRTQKNGRQSS
jgi:glucan phosphoethanolaminetransferase (alkaline phosphatase superfamily)